MKLSVTQNKIEITEGSLVNQGEYLATPLDFEFTKSYDGLVKYAVFIKKEDGATYKVPLVDDACDIPAEVLTEKGEFALGVYAFEVGENDELKLRYSPTPIKIQVDPGSYREGAINAGELTPTDTEIYMQKIQALIDDLTTKRDSGYFNGPKGEQGEPGTPGRDGQDGQDGVGIVSIQKTSSSGLVDTYTVTLTNGQTATFTVTNGEKGDPGAQGEPGVNGQDGQDGQDGVGIASVMLNADYTLTINFTDGTSTTTSAIRGEQGPAGQAASISIGTTNVNFGQATDSVNITNSGTSSAAVLNFEFNFAFADGNNVAY